MNCPVCNSSNLNDELKSCPECQSDLEAFQLTQSIDKTSKNRLNFGIIASVLFIVVLIFWLVTGFTGKPADPETSEEMQTEETQTQTERDQLKAEYDQLATENSQLKKQVTELKEQTKKKQKEYVVKEGESLFTIARKIYGNGYKYLDLAKDNNIENPDNLRAGQKLIVYF